jgi:hypothetical protein
MRRLFARSEILSVMAIFHKLVSAFAAQPCTIIDLPHS